MPWLKAERVRLLYCDAVAPTEVKDSDLSAVLNCHTPDGGGG